jgi:hypothetical protein
MTLDDILDAVEQSEPEQWQRVHIPIPYDWDDNGAPNAHRILAVYKPDVDISIALGATIEENLSEDWHHKFPDKHARSLAVVVRYRGSPVYDETFASVDGGRYVMPLPKRIENGSYVLEQAELPFARLIYRLAGSQGDSLDECLRRAEITIV